MWSRLSPANRAILFMIGAIFCFSSMDALAKAISMRSNPAMALWARYTGQMVLVMILVAPRLKSVLNTHYPRLQFLRSVFLLGATASFFTGLSFLGLAETTAIMGINPVLITLGAALFLGEKLGMRRVIGIAAGLVGAMIIIRPGTDAMSWAAIFPLMAALSYSGYSLATRFVGDREDPWTSLFYAALLGSVVTTVLAVLNWHRPDGVTIMLMLALSGVGTLGQLLFIRAFSSGEAGMLAPFTYCGLIFATFWGVLIFNEFPDRWTVVGAIVVVAAGIYVWHRETRKAPRLTEAKAGKTH